MASESSALTLALLPLVKGAAKASCNASSAGDASRAASFGFLCAHASELHTATPYELAQGRSPAQPLSDMIRGGDKTNEIAKAVEQDVQGVKGVNLPQSLEKNIVDTSWHSESARTGTSAPGLLAA
ncbi:hypothetical protein KC364_g45 [Hortaea werneckii]|nr:hypothetical protein KC364_g45 [Hortaea werneckii]